MSCFTRRRDALFELTDAVLAAGPVVSLPHLSLDPGYRRGHGSVYAALAKGRINTDALRDLLASRLRQQPAVFAVDVSCWPRSDAECSPGRGFYYHPARHSAGKPIIAGWAFSWLAGLELTTNSWTAPPASNRSAAPSGRPWQPLSVPGIRTPRASRRGRRTPSFAAAQCASTRSSPRRTIPPTVSAACCFRPVDTRPAAPRPATTIHEHLAADHRTRRSESAHR
ncbi:transposase [Streptosporangium canum]|uniref:transposase n=1 Tax=Streptosporangium canum TaxID=324952 RepID=UPI0036A7ABD0